MALSTPLVTAAARGAAAVAVEAAGSANNVSASGHGPG